MVSYGLRFSFSLFFWFYKASLQWSDSLGYSSDLKRRAGERSDCLKLIGPLVYLDICRAYGCFSLLDFFSFIFVFSMGARWLLRSCYLFPISFSVSWQRPIFSLIAPSKPILFFPSLWCRYGFFLCPDRQTL